MPMTHPEGVTLSDYVDGALPRGAAADLERHMAICENCRELVAELRALSRAVRTLEPIQPPPAVWEKVRAATARDRSRRGMWTWGGLALAASVVMAVMIQWQRATLPVPGDAGPAVPAMVADMSAQYGEAFAGLEQIAQADRAVLDEETRGAFETSLAAVDRAIDESRAAVSTEPDDDGAQMSLLESFKMKLALLQETVALINEVRRNADSTPAEAPES
jgi:hypothetical protein